MPLVCSSMQNLLYGVKRIMRKIVDQPKATREELVNDVNQVGITVTNDTIEKMQGSYGLKSCSNWKVPQLKKACGQDRITFSSKHVNGS